MVDSEATVQYAENHLAKYPWFGGKQFPNVAAWKKKAEARGAYQRMLKAARPDGMIGNLPRLPKHAPAGPR